MSKDIENKILDEAIRKEIKKRLPDEVKPFKWTSFLNSSFGLWLLSALFISGAGALYDHIMTARTEKAKSEAEIKSKAAENERRKSELELIIASRIVRAHAFFRVLDFEGAYTVLNGNPLAESTFSQSSFPILVHKLVELDDPLPNGLGATLRHSVELAALEVPLTSPDYSPRRGIGVAAIA